MVDITIKKNAMIGGSSGIEKGIAISQINGNIQFIFSYIFEVLIK
jgi:hypothetical protein